MQLSLALGVVGGSQDIAMQLVECLLCDSKEPSYDILVPRCGKSCKSIFGKLKITNIIFRKVKEHLSSTSFTI